MDGRVQLTPPPTNASESALYLPISLKAYVYLQSIFILRPVEFCDYCPMLPLPATFLDEIEVAWALIVFPNLELLIDNCAVDS